MGIIMDESGVLALMKAQMNAEMVQAAKPIIAKALGDIEDAMRKKLAVMVINYLDSEVHIERFGNSTLRITIGKGEGSVTEASSS